MTAQQPKECYDGTPCIDGKSDACNICYIPLQRGEKISCKLHTICRYCVNDCFNYNPDYKCDFDTRSSPHPAPDYMDVEIQAKLQLVREEAAKAERERVLDSVVIRCHFLIPPDILDEPHHRIERATLEKVFKEIKSLRGGEQR